ncbi:MAG: DUF6569 family protein [Myxococcota bacterium]
MRRLVPVLLLLGLAPLAAAVEGPGPQRQMRQQVQQLNPNVDGPSRASEPDGPPPVAPAHAILAAADIGQPTTAGRVTIWPLQARVPTPDTEFATLDEASARREITVEEVGDGGTVNTLHVTNTSKQTIYLMAGEVLLGGKQDRIVGRNTLVPPGATALEVPVFCVEHGRWQRQTEQFGTAGRLAHSKLRRSANAESQAAVWGEVKAANARLETDNPTDTYRASVKKLAADGDVTRAVATLQAGTGKAARVAGVIVAVDGALQGVEWFASPGLYRKLEPKLLASFVADALEAAAPSAAVRIPTREEVAHFIATADQSSARAERKGGDGKVYLFDTEAVEGQTIYRGKDKAPLHKSWFKKQ